MPILADYSSNHSQFTTWLCMAIAFFGQNAEAVIYVYLFWTVYKHDKTMMKMGILEPKTLKKRMTKSAISLTCEAYLYILDLL